MHATDTAILAAARTYLTSVAHVLTLAGLDVARLHRTLDHAAARAIGRGGYNPGLIACISVGNVIGRKGASLNRAIGNYATQRGNVLTVVQTDNVDTLADNLETIGINLHGFIGHGLDPLPLRNAA